MAHRADEQRAYCNRQINKAYILILKATHMSWAVIAGGSKGIGIHIANSLARREYNLLLVARNAGELLESKNRLEKEFTVQVETIPCDLSLPESASIISGYCDSRELDVRVLCNAAG